MESDSKGPEGKELDCVSKVEDYLYVSGDSVTNQLDVLESYGVTHIINCAAGMCRNHFADKFKYISLNYIDNTEQDLFELLYDALDCIDGVASSSSRRDSDAPSGVERGERKVSDTREGSVLVHCQQGVSRSCAVAIAYIMYKCKVDYGEAHRRVSGARPVCHPNVGFERQLREWHQRGLNHREGEVDGDDCTGDDVAVAVMFRVVKQSVASYLKKSKLAFGARSSWKEVSGDKDGDRFVLKSVMGPDYLSSLDSRGLVAVVVRNRRKRRHDATCWIGKDCSDALKGASDAVMGKVMKYEKASGPLTTIHQGEVGEGAFFSLLGLREGSPAADITTQARFDKDYLR